MRSTVAAILAVIATACAGTSPVAPTGSAAPIVSATPLGSTTVNGEWRGFLSIGACDPVMLRGFPEPCSPEVMWPFTRGIRITMTQRGPAISAAIQGDIAGGTLTGAVDGSGLVSLTGVVSTLTIGSGQSRGRPFLRFTRWRTVVDQTTGQLVGGLAYRILDANGTASVTEYVNQLQLPRCDPPRITGVYWEC